MMRGSRRQTEMCLLAVRITVAPFAYAHFCAVQNRDLPEPPQSSVLPERKRPPLAAPPSDRFGSLDSSKQKPLPSVRDADRPPAKEPNKINVPLKSPDRYAVQSSSIMETAEKAAPPSSLTVKTTQDPAAKEVVKSPEEPGKPDSEQKEEKNGTEEARPGLGRMFGGNKKTAKELFSKAATAYTAFKPRAGGAAAKLLATEPKSNEPDGITGVVPAPSLARTKTTDSARSGGSQDQSSIQATPTSAIGKKSIPDFKVTSPQTPNDKGPTAVSSTAEMISSQKLLEMQQKAAGLQQQTKAADEEAARRKLRRSPQQIKYLERLGVDPALLEGRGLEYESILDEFWPQNVWHTKSVDTLQSDIRRDLSRVQTGSWFGHLALHDDERQSAIKLIDHAAEECDALEKLLTIYSVELGVSRLLLRVTKLTDPGFV
jgi:exocyst complex component 1